MGTEIGRELDVKFENVFATAIWTKCEKIIFFDIQFAITW